MNFGVPENPVFSNEIRKLEITDKGHADTFNPNYEKLYNNTVYLKKRVENIATEEDIDGLFQ